MSSSVYKMRQRFFLFEPRDEDNETLPVSALLSRAREYKV